MKTYENNMADQALVVKRLTVLESAEGGAFKEIRQTVDAVKKQTSIIAQDQDKRWEALSDDGIITPFEKQELLRTMREYDREFAAVTQQASTLGVESRILNDYVRTYNALRDYIFTTLKLFDDMQSETKIDNRDTFNTYFSNYSFSYNFVMLAITAGILDTIDFRVLQSLNEPGEEGETAIYHGGLYQYVNGEWKNVTTGAYKGPRTELPPDEEESFFIVSKSFLMADVLIVNGEELLVNNDTLLISHTYQKGYIYYFQDGTWHPEWDKTNWRYAAAFADVISITGALPQIFQDAIDNLQTQIDVKASTTTLEQEIAERQGQETIINGELIRIDEKTGDIIAEVNAQAQDISDLGLGLTDLSGTVSGIGSDLTDLSGTVSGLSTTVTQQGQAIATKISHLPVYFGGRSTAPTSPQEGDFYLFTGSGTNNSKIRRYHNGDWEWLDPGTSAYRNYYMMALEDILVANNASSGYFSQLFASAFWTNTAVINTLETKTLYLQYGGAIQSANIVYSEEQRGLRIDCDGNIDANGNTHLGASTDNKVAIGVPLSGNTDFDTYNTVIGGKTLIKDDVKITGDVTIGQDAEFEGSIINNSFSVERLEQSTIGLFRKEKTDMKCGEVPFIIATMLNINYYNSWEGSIDVTLTDKTLYVYRPGIISNDCDAIYLDFHGTEPFLVADYKRYCLFKVHIKNGSWVTIINYGSVDEDYNWQNVTLSGLTIFDLYSIVTDIAKVKYGVLPNENPMEEGQVYNDNGLLKISGQNQPWKYFEFPDQTDVRYVFDTIRVWLPSGYSVACIGYYGTSDSSSNNCITSVSAVGGNLVFRNHNDTEKLSIPSSRVYGSRFLNGKLAVLLLIP